MITIKTLRRIDELLELFDKAEDKAEEDKISLEIMELYDGNMDEFLDMAYYVLGEQR